MSVAGQMQIGMMLLRLCQFGDRIEMPNRGLEVARVQLAYNLFAILVERPIGELAQILLRGFGRNAINTAFAGNAVAAGPVR